MDPQEACTAVKLAVSIPQQAAEEAKDNPKLRDRLIEAYQGLFSGVANKIFRISEIWYGQDKAETKPERLSSPGLSTPRETSGSDEEALDGIY